MQKYGSLLLTIAVFLAFLLCPTACAEGVREGLALSATQALPALFPFFIASGLLVRSGVVDELARLLSRPLWRIYGLPPAGAGALLLGLVGGYPVGAATVSELLARDRLSNSDASRLVAFCNCASPAFVINLCGVMLFGSVKIGVILYLIHALSALLTGLFVTRRPGHRFAPPENTPHIRREAFPTAFCGAVQSAAQTALIVTAFIAAFSVLLELLAPIIHTLPDAPVFSGLLELTNGLDHLNELTLPAAVLLPLTSFMLGFGGLSVHCQVHALLAPYGVPMRRFTLGKVLHGLIAAGLTIALGRLLPQTLAVFAPDPTVSPLPDWVAIAALLVLVLFPFWTGKKHKDTV